MLHVLVLVAHSAVTMTPMSSMPSMMTSAAHAAVAVLIHGHAAIRVLTSESNTATAD